MRFPSIKDVSRALRCVDNSYKEKPEPGEDTFWIDVRLQVWPDGSWNVHTGDSSYDQDHRGFWGCSSIPGCSKRFSSAKTARELLDECREDFAMSGEQEV